MNLKVKIVISLIVLMILAVTFLIVFSGSNVKIPAILMGVNCDPQACSFLLKGTDEIISLRIFSNQFNLELNPQYHFTHNGNYTFPISLQRGAIIDYLLLMSKTGSFSGSVIVK